MTALLGALASLVFIALWVYCVFEVIQTDEVIVRNLPKMIWLLIVIFVPTIGSIAWLLLGRPEGAPFGFGSVGARSLRSPAPRGPDDSPEFLSGIDPERERLRKWEEDLERRERDLRRKENGEGPNTPDN